MIGDMIAKARKEKGMSKTELARLTDINIGHITHIEKGERNPSHKALKSICKALDIPYQPLMFTYDKKINEEQASYNVIDHISYSRVLAVDTISGFIECPSSIPSSAVAIKLKDDSMEPSFTKGAYVFVELNTPLENKNIGIFSLNDKILVRRFITKKGKIFLKSDNKKYDEIEVSSKDSFYIIGKVCV